MSSTLRRSHGGVAAHRVPFINPGDPIHHCIFAATGSNVESPRLIGGRLHTLRGTPGTTNYVLRGSPSHVGHPGCCIEMERPGQGVDAAPSPGECGKSSQGLPGRLRPLLTDLRTHLSVGQMQELGNSGRILPDLFVIRAGSRVLCRDARIGSTGGKRCWLRHRLPLPI